MSKNKKRPKISISIYNYQSSINKKEKSYMPYA